MKTVKSRDLVVQVKTLLLELGFCPAGETKSETVKAVTQASYPIPGKVVTFGGRERFRLGEIFVTVGPQTTCIYTKSARPDRLPSSCINFKTRHLDAVRDYLTAKIKQVEGLT